MAPKEPPKSGYLNIRFPEGLLKEIDTAIRETRYVKDADGMRSEWVRDAAATRARAERGMLSGRLGAIVERYEMLMERSRPYLNRAGWQILINATGSGIGYTAGNERFARGLLKLRVEEYLLTRDAAPELVDTMSRWTDAQALAVLDVCERHWAAVARGEEPPALPGEEAEPAPPEKKKAPPKRS